MYTPYQVVPAQFESAQQNRPQPTMGTGKHESRCIGSGRWVHRECVDAQGPLEARRLVLLFLAGWEWSDDKQRVTMSNKE